MATGGVGLAFQWTSLAPDLAQEIPQSYKVGFGGLQSALRALPTTTVLEDASGLLDDRSAILGAAVEHGRQLTLAHDDVLLAAHSGVAEQLLDIKEPTGHAVDGVLAVTGPKQGAHDGDLGEANGQHTGVVVDGE